MTEPDTDPSLREVALAAARTSDAAAELLASVAEMVSSIGAMVSSIGAAHAAGVSITDTGRGLIQGRNSARERLAHARTRPSVLLRQHSAEILSAASGRGLSNVRVFGSCVRGTDTPASDVDLLVSEGKRTSLLTISAFAIAVADILNLEEERVDVVTLGGLVPGSHIERQITAEAQPLAAWATPAAARLPARRHGRRARS